MAKKQYITISPIQGYQGSKKITPIDSILELEPNDKTTIRWLNGGTIKPYVKPPEPKVVAAPPEKK